MWNVAALASGGLSLILLLSLSSKLNNEIFKQTGGALKVNYEIGYWLVLLASLGVIEINLVAVAANKDMGFRR